MDAEVRAVGAHVEYETQLWEPAFLLTLTIATRWLSVLVKCVSTDKWYLEQAIRIACESIVHSPHHVCLLDLGENLEVWKSAKRAYDFCLH